MRTKKIRIRKNDALRALLTDTLPYELPILFSNESLYLTEKNDDWTKLEQETGIELPKGTDSTIPYRYQIRKNAYESRTLALIHPRVQTQVAKFYAEYEHLITGLCQRSEFSLRAPHAVASYYVENTRATPPKPGSVPQVEISGSGFDKSPTVGTSYFSYRKYPFLYRFYESIEFIELEKQYRFLTRLDLSDCFNRIYTHTIAWAVKSKEHAKRNMRTENSFESKFDRLMMWSNHLETAGIVIGPEFSRIFAEIILQRIDLNIEGAAEKFNLKLNRDYSIRRYVDDYFVFTNSETARDQLKAIIASSVSEYRLAINTAKTKDLIRPYITETSIARAKISIALDEFFDRHREFVKPNGESRTRPIFKKSFSRGSSSLRAIVQIKQAVGTEGSYESCANYFFGILRRQLAAVLSKIQDAAAVNDGSALIDFLLSLVEIIFFYYSMTPRARQTYVVAELVIQLSEFASLLGVESADKLRRRIANEAYRLIDWHTARNGDNDPNGINRLELLNLLLSLKTLGETYALSEERLISFLSITKSSNGVYIFPEDFDYFNIGFLIAYSSGRSDLAPLHSAVFKFSSGKFSEKDCLKSAELFCLFFDLLGCPHYPKSTRIDFAKTVLGFGSRKHLNARAAKLVETTGGRDWFFMWRKQAHLTTVLKKKELRTPY